jgi:hypothetical protein
MALPIDIDLDFLIRWELGGGANVKTDSLLGYGMKFEFPGNAASGATIGIGIDLGHLDLARFDYIFKDRINAANYLRFRSGLGLKGDAAKIWVAKNKDLKITKEDVKITFARIIEGFWNSSLRRYSGLGTCPGAVKTAILSIGYNRGVFNSDSKMVELVSAISKKDFTLAANIVDTMQEGTFWQKRLSVVYRGVNRRRDSEAALIRTVLKK